MLRSVNNLIGYTISAKDGEIGKVYEFYFDDFSWYIRYLVVETGNWLFEKKVLIPHSALGMTDWESKTFKVNLTMEQVGNCPDIDTERPVSRQHEIELFSHYTLPFYWGDASYEGSFGMLPLSAVYDANTIKGEADAEKMPHGDPHLRSTRKVESYSIQGSDGEVGHVEDFVIDDENWNLVFLIVDTKNWLPGRKVLISPCWIGHIDWEESNVYINLSQEAIKNSPKYDPSQPIDKKYEGELFSHYGFH